jgi:1-deoxy-D-xylulose-5-phosphate synthase
VFGQWLCDMAEPGPRLVGITPAMREGSGMVEFHRRFPDRYYDVGIAEQHAVTFAAGLACEGLKPVVAIYSTFLQRAYDQLIHDVAIQNLPVVLALDRAGLVGADGATHAGNYDIAYLRCIPNVSVACPADERECRQLLTTAFEQDHAVAVRYPRGAGVGVAPLETCKACPSARASAPPGPAHGHPGLRHPAVPGAGRRPSAWAPRWSTCAGPSRSTPSCCCGWPASHEALVTVEEGAIMGGAGSAVAEALAAAGVLKPLLQLGCPTVHRAWRPGAPAGLQGLDAAGIEASVRRACRNG